MGYGLSFGIPALGPEELLMHNTASFPPWIMLWPPFFMDIICIPLQCRYTWRNYVPFGLSDPGGWFSEEFEIVNVVKLLPTPLTFENFRATQGYKVTPGTGLLAGVHSIGDVNEWLNSLYEYLFKTPSTSLSNLFTPTAIAMVLLLVLVIKAFKIFVMPQFNELGRNMAVRAHGEEWPKNNEDRITKFGEYVYRLCYHSFISLVGFYLFWNAPWWDEDQGGTLNLYIDWPGQPIQPSMAWYYLLQAAYNVDAMISLLEISVQVKLFPNDSILPIGLGWASTVRGDFNEMFAHHIVTNLLVFGSSCLYQTRIGSMVFWIHDISDVPVDLSKLANFVKWEAGTIVFFIVLTIAWAFTRLYILPVVIWRSILLHSQEIGRGQYSHFWCYFYAYQPCFVILLAVLIILHFVWFSMMLKIGYILVSKGERHDLTEHKHGENAHGDDKPNGKTATNGKTKTN